MLKKCVHIVLSLAELVATFLSHLCHFVITSHHELLDLVIGLTVINHILWVDCALISMVDGDTIHHNHIIGIKVTRYGLLVDVRRLALPSSRHEVVTKRTTAIVTRCKA